MPEYDSENGVDELSQGFYCCEMLGYFAVKVVSTVAEGWV